jgi:hypothetical protein
MVRFDARLARHISSENVGLTVVGSHVLEDFVMMRIK